MLGFYISIPFLIFALYRLVVVLYNYFTRPFLPIGIPKDNPLVSILVYVRNSEKNIGNLIQGLTNQTHQNFEVLIYNDQSNDKSVDVIGEISAGDKRFRLFNGNDINNGWQRKNYAFDKLSQIAKGQYHIFINADFIVDNQFIANAVSHMQVKSLSLLTIYPKAKSQSFWTRTQIDAIQWMFFSLVSVKLYLRKRAEDGGILENPIQIVEADNYKQNRWYEKFNDDEFPEDKIVKAACDLKLNNFSILSDNSLSYLESCSFNERLEHLSDSIVTFLKSRNLLISYTVASTLGLILAIFLLPFPLFFLYLFSILFGRMLVALLCQESVFGSLLFLPLQQFILLQVLFKAIKKSRKQSA